MTTVTDYRFNAYAVGKTREEVEKSARAQAEEYFGTAELDFLRADVTLDNRETRERIYEGTFSFAVKAEGTFSFAVR